MPTSNNLRKPYIILGIDPGYADMGFGVIRVAADGLHYIMCTSIKSGKKEAMPDRLVGIDMAMKKILKQYKPDVVAIEKIFFAANQKTAIEVAQARGVMLMQAASHHTAILEFTPMQVKQALTSYGNADKRQVAHMVGVILKETDLPKQDDALDALAIAVTAAFHLKTQ